MPVIDPLRPQPVARAARPVQFVTCGRLHTVKGFDILLKALRQLHDLGHRAQLIIGGGGPAKDSLLKLRDELRLQDDVEFAGWICPLTPFENWLRVQGGAATYTTGFVERHLLPVLYPASLSRDVQWTLGLLVILLNGIVYAVVVRSRRKVVGTR